MSAKNGILAFLAGAAAGAVVALLFAPEKGEVTRRKIGNAVKEGRDNVLDAMDRGREALYDAVERGRDTVEDMISKGKDKIADAVHTGKEILHDEVDMLCEEASNATKAKRDR